MNNETTETTAKAAKKENETPATFFICTSEEHDAFNVFGEKTGVTGKRALFYCKSIGKHRVYRGFLSSPDKDMALLEFRDKAKAQEICDGINEAYNDDFKVEEHHNR